MFKTSVLLLDPFDAPATAVAALQARLSGCMIGGSSSKSSSAPVINQPGLNMLNANGQQAQNVVANTYQPYGGLMSAPLAPNQQQALAAAPYMGQVGAPQINSAANTDTSLTNYQPPTAGANYAQPGLMSGPATYNPALINGAPQAAIYQGGSTGYRPTMLGSAPTAAPGLMGAPASATAGLMGPAATAQAGLMGPAATIGGIGNIGASDISGMLGKFMSPYTSSVVNATNAQIEQQRERAAMANNQNATAMGAFGGNRQGVADALTNQAYDLNTAQTDAALNEAGFSQASNLAAQQAANQQAAATQNQNTAFNVGQFNAGAQNQTGMFNAGNVQAARLANAAAQNQAAQFNAGNVQQANQFNAGQANNVGLFNAGNQQQTNLANQGLQGIFAQANQGAANAAGQFGAGAANTAGLANLGAANSGAQYNSGLLASILGQNQSAANAAAATNAAATNQAGEFNAGNVQQANLTNAGAANNMAQFNVQSNLAGAGVQQNAANSLAGASGQMQQQFGNYITSLLNTGQIDQSTLQNNLSALYQEFLRGQQYPFQGQQLINQSLGLVPATLGQNSTMTQKSSPGIGGLLGGAGSIGQGIGAMLGSVT